MMNCNPFQCIPPTRHVANHWKILLRTDQISPQILILTPPQSITPELKTEHISIGNIEYEPPGARNCI